MIKIFTGEDRGKISEEVKRELGERYEVVEGENLTSGGLNDIFLGMSLLVSGERKILIKDLGGNKEVFGELAERIEDFIKTEARVILWETKLDKRTVVVKKLLKAGVEAKEFKVTPVMDTRAVFGIFDLSLRDGRRAVEELEKIEAEQDPFMFFGLLVTQALKKLEWKPKGERERKIIKALAETDMLMKGSGLEPWTLIKALLLRLEKI